MPPVFCSAVMLCVRGFPCEITTPCNYFGLRTLTTTSVNHPSIQSRRQRDKSHCALTPHDAHDGCYSI
eukprot:8485179-Pyramimonas_sp.AAC.1